MKPLGRPLVVAIYARVSKAEQNPEMQLRELREYCGRRGWEQYHWEFIDKVTGDVSRRQARKNRKDPGYKLLWEHAMERRFDAVLVWKYDRFARSTQELLKALETFKALDIDFISMRDGVDTTTPQGKLFFTFIAGFAEFEKDMIRERVTAGLSLARSQGKQLGRPRDLAVEDTVGKMNLDGASLSEIADKVGWSRSGVRKIILRIQERKGAL